MKYMLSLHFLCQTFFVTPVKTTKGNVSFKALLDQYALLGVVVL